MITEAQNLIAEQISEAYPHNDTAFFIYLEMMSYGITEGWADHYSEFEENYVGQFYSYKELAEYVLDGTGLVPDDGSILSRYFDYDYFGRDLILGGDYWEQDNYYFRSN